jgi:brefeldin A-inhibited guanine nucleotide-exchange protein
MEAADGASDAPSALFPPESPVIRLQLDEESVTVDFHADDRRMYLGEESNAAGEDENEGEAGLREAQVNDEVGSVEGEDNRVPVAGLQEAPTVMFTGPDLVHQVDINEQSASVDRVVESSNLPPTPPAKSSLLPETTRGYAAQSSIHPATPLNGHEYSSPTPPASTEDNPVSTPHRRSLTISKGHTVSVVLISTALDTIAASKEAKRSTQLRDSTQTALQMIRSNQAGDRPREIFEPLRLACETRNEKLMIASLDCISKLISYSFFAESDSHPSVVFHSPPPSPRLPGRSSGAASQSAIAQPSLVDLVAHTITSCHTETTPETVSLQIVKALLSLVLSPTILVHHSSLLKAVRTVYNVFLLSTDPVNQMVAQGGLTQIVHHVFNRCRIGRGPRSDEPTLPASGSQENAPLSSQGSFTMRTPEFESTPFVDAGSGGVGPSSEHDVHPPLPPSSDGVGSHEVEPEVTGDVEGRRLSNESQSAQSQITLYVMHAITFCIYT